MNLNCELRKKFAQAKEKLQKGKRKIEFRFLTLSLAALLTPS